MLAIAHTSFAEMRSLTLPLSSRNMSPIYANLGVPVMRAATPLPEGQIRAAWQLHWASHSLIEGSAEGVLSLDGETQRNDFTVRAGVTPRMAITATLTHTRHSTGWLDKPIDEWHALWGLPEGVRPEQPRDALQFLLTTEDGFNLDTSRAGIGDAELGASYQLYDSHRFTLASFTQVKLATGDARDFTGSGEPGVALGARVSAAQCGSERIQCHAQLGVLHTDGSLLDLDADRRVVFGSFSVGWQFAENFALVGQLDSHSVVYRNAPLNSAGAPLWGSLALRWQPAAQFRLEAGFNEDFVVGASPDISFMLNATWVAP